MNSNNVYRPRRLTQAISAVLKLVFHHRNFGHDRPVQNLILTSLDFKNRTDPEISIHVVSACASESEQPPAHGQAHSMGE
jgi:hypothetical protein